MQIAHLFGSTEANRSFIRGLPMQIAYLQYESIPIIIALLGEATDANISFTRA